jgi:RNA polymerase sigma factor (sigma-70 family)
VQEAFTKIFRILPTYDSSKAQLKTYIAKVTTNLVIDYMRHGSELRLHTVSLSTDLSVLKVYAEQDSEVLRLAAEQIVDGLRDKSKVPMIRDLLRGREVKEICADYRVTEYQVYTTRNWLRDLLREVSASVGSS